MRNKGFTLTELMIVVTLMSLIGSIAITNMNVATRKARDSRRIGDQASLVKALGIYGSEHVAMPPCGLVSDCAGGFLPGSCLANALTPYIDHVPKDPLGNPFCYSICTAGDSCTNAYAGSPYWVRVEMEQSLTFKDALISNP